MHGTGWVVVLAVAGHLASPAGAHAEPARHRVLALSEANRVIEAGIARATDLHAHAVIAVVDAEGLLIAMQRMDDPDLFASIELAPAKARAAALFKKPSAALEDAIDGGRFAAVTAPGFTQMIGGVPIVLDGEIVGAVGVSTATPAHDKDVSEFASQALARAP